MLDANLLLKPLDVASLVPEIYAEFRPMVSDAVAFFLRHLSPGRLEAILAEQISLPMQTDLATRVVRFMRHCPALHKLGQVIARNRALAPSFRRQLQRLETMSPRTPMPNLLPIIREELGAAIDRYRIHWEASPLAEASVAVVVPIHWRHPGDPLQQQGVLKILKPGIVDLLREDLDILQRLADHFDRQKNTLAVPAVAYRETFDEVRRLLTHEVLLKGEQRHLLQASRQFAHDPRVQIPTLLPFSTGKITAMERVRGRKVTEILTNHRRDRRRLAETIVRSLVTDVVFSRRERTLFHADPHAGNLFVTDDGRLAILDWSLAGELSRDQRVQLVQIIVGAASLDAGRVYRALEILSADHAELSRCRRHVKNALAEVRRGRLPGVGWLMRLLDSLARNGVRFPSNLLLFRKAYFTLEGVVADVCPDQTLEQILTAQAAEQFVFEWPGRLLHAPLSRDFPTHLSNTDLLCVAAAVPANLLRAWIKGWLAYGPWPTAAR